MGNSSSKEAISIQGATKSYGAVPVLHNLDLEVGWGERLVLFGVNGSGKTTLVKLLATLARPNSGRIEIAGLDVRRHGAQARRSMGVVTHQTLLYDDLTAYENLRFYGRMFRVADLEQRISRVADLTGIEHRLKARTRTLSHGMQKRLSLARALLHSPPILIMDEPETGLDQEALEVLEGVVQNTAKAVLMTTHNLDRGLSLASRVAILAKGRIAYQAPREGLDANEFRRVFDSYKETF